MVEWMLIDRGSGGAPPIYFEKWTGIGPCGTYDHADAARFPSEQAAMQSPAFSFPLTFYKPERIEAANSQARTE